MNTNQLKKFAQEARTKLMEQVGAKLSFVLSADTAVLREKAGQLKQLREELNRTSKQQLIEKVAYTWFNRLIALRFMDANDYQPLGIRVITPKDGYSIPELLDEAKRGNIPEELRLNRQTVYDLLDNRIPSANPQNEAFKELLIAYCNHLHSTFPFLFERINDYTELLMPDDLTSDFSIVTQVRNGMPADDCQNVEIIGWLYQFYISEKKDEVFASKEKVKKEDIPAATQLFTPRWIVEYMVQNTVGKLWMQNHPTSRLKEHMPYFIESALLTAEDYLKVSSPEEIRLLDPASGSGHILVYGFDLFTKIYEEQGYNTNDIPKLIIEKNLYGFEIDERAAQLSALALMMKARGYQRRAFRKDLQSNIQCFQDLRFKTGEITETLSLLNRRVSDELIQDLNQMQQATNFGSLILPHSRSTEIEQVSEKLKQFLPNADVFQRNKIEELIISIEQLQKLAAKYHCVVTNPPYMGGGNMNGVLSDWVKTYYPISKADLFSCFIERCINFTPSNGYNGLVTMESWMFLSSFIDFREFILGNCLISSLIHMPYLGKGGTSMGINFGTSSFIFRITDLSNSEMGHYQYIRYFETDINGVPLKFPTINERLNQIDQKEFTKIPSSPIAYWLSPKWIKVFEEGIDAGSLYYSKEGLKTANNERFIRYWYEVSILKSTIYSNKAKWFPHTKGGDFRKWFGNHLYFLNYENKGFELKSFKPASLTATENYFKPYVSWSRITSSKISFRYTPEGFIPNMAGLSLVEKSNIHPLLSFCSFSNTKICQEGLKVLNPTLNFPPGTIANLPFKEIGNNNSNNIAKLCIEISTSDWDSYEKSWNFNKSELVTIGGEAEYYLTDAFDYYTQRRRINFFQLHKQEEELNRQFIKLYKLEGELTTDVPLEDITILQDELDRKALAKLNKALIRDPETNEVLNYDEIELPFIPQEVMAQFISYAVGCMFGRYSLDKEGLLLANQGETLQDYLHKIGKSAQECSFVPDEDNIIPVLDNEWFEDDIVGRFNQFLKVTFGENNFNKNLAFIEEQIGRDIRSYFIKDFYPDHIQRYKKRPIYWMFSSLKGSFSALIYLHRYTPDTVSNILNKYLKEFIGKLKTHKEHLERVQISGSPSEKTKAIKETDSIDKMLIELQEYERDVLFPLATERIAIDLDDGVLVNYNKFGKAIKEIIGLNDKQTKDKVRKFDWIDTTQIQ